MEKTKSNKYKIEFTSRYKKDYKRYLSNEKKLAKIDATILLLEEGGVNNLPQNMRAHFLKGEYAGHLECHIEPDLLVIWLQYDEELKRILLVRLGSHSELF